jgi:hypothetical protein
VTSGSEKGSEVEEDKVVEVELGIRFDMGGKACNP